MTSYRHSVRVICAATIEADNNHFAASEQFGQAKVILFRRISVVRRHPPVSAQTQSDFYVQMLGERSVSPLRPPAFPSSARFRAIPRSPKNQGAGWSGRRTRDRARPRPNERGSGSLAAGLPDFRPPPSVIAPAHAPRGRGRSYDCDTAERAARYSPGPAPRPHPCVRSCDLQPTDGPIRSARTTASAVA